MAYLQAGIEAAIAVPASPVERTEPQMLETLSDIAVPVALGAVVVVLGLGLWNMMRGSSPNRSQSLMRWRVGLQLLAIIVIMAAIWLKSAG
ncbi:MAG: twin transmembrane helix small protein [Flavobacteriaceae bacterium]